MRTGKIFLCIALLIVPCISMVNEQRKLKSKNHRKPDSMITPDSIVWPKLQRAAVCLTYDDAADSHLDIAVPDLEKYGFKGTFYVTGKSRALHARVEEWREISARGHELGNHSLFHPCIKEEEGREAYDWVLPEYDLDNYTFSRIKDELKMANFLLHLLDGKTERTLAYPCADYTVAGRQSYTDSIQHLFIAARAAGPVPKSLKHLNIFNVPSMVPVGVSAEELIRYAQEAAENGTIAVYMFHGVGYGWMNVSREVHDEFLQYLDANREVYWTETFLNVMKHLKSEKERITALSH